MGGCCGNSVAPYGKNTHSPHSHVKGSILQYAMLFIIGELPPSGMSYQNRNR